MPHKVTEDEFLAWRDHPITQWVFRAIERYTDAQKEEWIQRSWIDGEPDPLALVELRTRADAYRALRETDFSRWSELNEVADT